LQRDQLLEFASIAKRKFDEKMDGLRCRGSSDDAFVCSACRKRTYEWCEQQRRNGRCPKRGVKHDWTFLPRRSAEQTAEHAALIGLRGGPFNEPR
jgi:hypothetical protein